MQEQQMFEVKISYDDEYGEHVNDKRHTMAPKL